MCIRDRFSDFLPQWLGMGRSLIGELILLGTAVGAVAVFGGKFRSVFPIHKPKLTEVMGTILIYLGASQAISVVTMIEMYIACLLYTSKIRKKDSGRHLELLQIFICREEKESA